MYELLIFDLDGTLIDSRYDLTDAVNYAIAPLNRPQLSYDDLPALLGSGLKYLLEEVANTKDEVELETARQRFYEYYKANFASKTRPYDGVMETLKQLQTEHQLAIYSNKPQYFTTKVADALELTPYFDLVQGAAPEAYPLKPHPAGVERILKKLNVAAQRSMMIGDSTHDMEAARAAGIKACAVTYGYRSAAELEQTGPDYMIDAFAELLQTLR